MRYVTLALLGACPSAGNALYYAADNRRILPRAGSLLSLSMQMRRVHVSELSRIGCHWTCEY